MVWIAWLVFYYLILYTQMFSTENYWQLCFSHWDDVDQKDVEALNNWLRENNAEVTVQVETTEDWVTFRFIPS